MMLSDKEINSIAFDTRFDGIIATTRALEAAVIAKLAGVSVEPVALDWVNGSKVKLFDESQLAAARVAALEEAVKAANRRADSLEQHLVNNGPEMVDSAQHFTQGAISASRRIEAAIRALIGKEST